MKLTMERRRHAGRQCVWLAACLLVLGCAGVRGESPPAPVAPERQELWVPTEYLERVLKDYPNAVMLTPEQYQALIKDAGKMKPEDDPSAAKAPREIVVEGLKLRGKVETPGATSVKLTGELVLHVPAEGWVQSRVSWPWLYPMLNASSDGPLLVHASVQKQDAGREAPDFMVTPSGERRPVPPTLIQHLNLAMKGPGRRVLKFESVVPILSGRERLLRIPHLPFGGVLEVELPDGITLLESSAYERSGPLFKVPFDHRFDGFMTISMPGAEPGHDACRLRWIDPTPRLPTAPLTLHDQAQARYVVNEAEVSAFVTLNAQAQAVQGRQTEVAWRVMGAGAEVVNVSGTDVVNWRQAGDQVTVTLNRSPSARPIEVQLRSPWDEKATADLALPTLDAGRPLKAELTITVSEGLDLLSVTGVLEAANKQYFSLGRDQPKIRVQTARPRLESDVDALVKLDRDSVNIKRTLALRTDRPLREVKLTLPAGEEFIAIESAAAGFEWKRVDRTLELRFPKALTPATPATVTLTSRKKLAKAWSGPRIPETITLENITLAEAVKVAGYTALEFDDAWRVSLKDMRGLEDRDARLTPVKGRMAWFGLREWTLGMEVERAESVYSAEITAYALPRARTVEIEGQILLDISGAPLRTFQVRLPAALAKLLRVTSPLVGEQQLDETAGLWTFTLRQESKGQPNIRFRMSLPAGVDNDADKTVRATLPHLQMPQARRFHGIWVVEANTDTRLAFESQSMQPLDVLRAPAVVGYQPRHRLVSAFSYGAGAHELKITAERHEHSELAVLVVNRLVMTSVLSTDGTSRHEAIVNLRHSGEQFVSLRLPAEARLLSVMVEHASYKPVRGDDGTLAIPLPSDSANRASVRVVVLYDLPGTGWGESGKQQLSPVTFPGNVPILTTEWRVHVPEGFSYGEVKTRLDQTGNAPDQDLWNVLFGLPQKHRQASGDDPRVAMLDRLKAKRQELAKTEQITAVLQQMVIPQVEFGGASIEDAVQFLRQQFIEQAKARDEPPVRIVFLPGPSKNPAQISLSLKDVTAIEALRYITELAGMRYQLSAGKVTILEHDEFGRMETEVIKVPSDIVDRFKEPVQGMAQVAPFGDPGQTTADTYPPGSAEWWVKLLKNQGIAFPDGSDIIHDQDRGELLVTNSRSNIELLQLIIENKMTSAERLDQGRETGPAIQEDPAAYVTRKMRSIIFPNIQFGDATIEEAIEFLRLKSRDLDVDEADPAKRGVNLIVKGSDTPSTAGITLDLKDVPLVEALRYVTELAGMKYKVKPFGVVVMPVSDTATEQYTRSFKVHPDFLTAIPPGPAAGAAPDPFAAGGAADSQTGLLARPTAADILKAQGIAFPAGSSAIFNPVTSQLIVTGTQPNLDLVETFVSSLNAAAAERAESVKIGLLPLDLEIPTAGTVLRFSGEQAPEPLTLSFISWERQLASSCLWILLGVAGFVTWGRRRAGRRTFLVALLLTAGVVLIVPTWLTTANAVLFGWLAALLAWLLWRLVLRLPQPLSYESKREVAV